MIVGDFHTLFYFIIDKSSGQGDISAEEFNIIANTSQYSYQDFLIGEIQQYQYGRPIARIEYSFNEVTRQKLTPFITDFALIVDGNGKANYPPDFILVDALLDANNNRIRFVTQDRLYSFLDSEIDVIATNPIYLIKDAGFQFFPITLATAQLSYIKKASAIFYATTQDANGREIQDVTNSKDPLWYEADCLQILVRMLNIAGVPMQLNQVIQYANQIKTQGE